MGNISPVDSRLDVFSQIILTLDEIKRANKQFNLSEDEQSKYDVFNSVLVNHPQKKQYLRAYLTINDEPSGLLKLKLKFYSLPILLRCIPIFWVLIPFAKIDYVLVARRAPHLWGVKNTAASKPVRSVQPVCKTPGLGKKEAEKPCSERSLGRHVNSHINSQNHARFFKTAVFNPPPSLRGFSGYARTTPIALEGHSPRPTP